MRMFPGALMGGSADVASGAYEHTIVMQTLAQKQQAFAPGHAPVLFLNDTYTNVLVENALKKYR